MQNLLNEQDFVKPVKYNPWKWFLLFYGIVIGYLICKFLFKAILKENITYVGPLFAITDFALPFVMIFAKKENIYVHYKTIIVAITGIYVILLSVQLIQVYLDLSTNPLIPKSIVFFAAKNYIIDILPYWALNLLIILSIIIFKRKTKESCYLKDFS